MAILFEPNAAPPWNDVTNGFTHARLPKSNSRLHDWSSVAAPNSFGNREVISIANVFNLMNANVQLPHIVTIDPEYITKDYPLGIDGTHPKLFVPLKFK